MKKKVNFAEERMRSRKGPGAVIFPCCCGCTPSFPSIRSCG